MTDHSGVVFGIYSLFKNHPNWKFWTPNRALYQDQQTDVHSQSDLQVYVANSQRTHLRNTCTPDEKGLLLYTVTQLNKNYVNCVIYCVILSVNCVVFSV